MNTETYNGWTNWDTWNTSLHLTNDETTYKCCRMCKDENGIKGVFNEFFPDSIDEIDITKVNWLEVYEGV